MYVNERNRCQRFAPIDRQLARPSYRQSSIAKPSAVEACNVTTLLHVTTTSNAVVSWKSNINITSKMNTNV